MHAYHYDLHIHSCLSPCADNDMTPANIAGMASLNGLEIVALTDHNSCGNCAAFCAAAEARGIVPVAGMELTTAEDIHLVCLFERLADALAFDAEVQTYRMRIPNREAVFGEQIRMDERDHESGREAFLLPPATMLALDDAAALVAAHGGVCWPAHIDRAANGILGVLGIMPTSPVFPCAEYADAANREALEEKFPILRNMRVLVSSDAHHLWDIAEAGHTVDLEELPGGSDRIRERLFRLLRGETEHGQA